MDKQPITYVFYDNVPLETFADRLPPPETMQAIFDEFAPEHPIRARWLSWVMIPVWKAKHRLKRALNTLG